MTAETTWWGLNLQKKRKEAQNIRKNVVRIFPASKQRDNEKIPISVYKGHKTIKSSFQYFILESIIINAKDNN